MISADCAEFLLVHQISKKGRADIPHLIAVKEIISVIEMDGKIFIQMDRDEKGRTKIGIPVRESFEEIVSALRVVNFYD